MFICLFVFFFFFFFGFFFFFFFFFLFFLFFYLNLCISNGTVSTKIYDKRDDFNFDTVNFPFWMAMFPGVPHMGYTYLNLFDSLDLLQILMTLTAVIKPLLPNFLGRDRYFKLRKAFSKFIADTVPW